jgi:hypothetical protein
MEERSSIFSGKGDGERIGYIEGAEVFNVSGQRRCRYDRQTGNLRDLRNGEIVGHVSLEGRFVGLSWRADKLFRQFDDDIDGAVLQEQASPNGVGEQPAGQELAAGENQIPKNRDGEALHPLRQVLAVANEVFGQRAAEDDQGVSNVGESPNPLSELAEPAIPTNSTGEWSGPSEEAERIFEMLGNRIGLSAERLRNVEKKPNPVSEREEPNIPTSSDGEQSKAFPTEVERVFEMLRDRIGLNVQHPHNAGETPNPQSERGEAAIPTTKPAEQSVPFSQEVERVFETLRDKELD